MTIQLTEDTVGKSWIYRLPIPQTKILLGVVLAVATFLVVFVLMLREVEISEGVLAVLLTFIGALFGIAHFDYKTKRNTDLDFQHVKQGTATDVLNGSSRDATQSEEQDHRWRDSRRPEGLG